MVLAFSGTLKAASNDLQVSLSSVRVSNLPICVKQAAAVTPKLNGFDTLRLSQTASNDLQVFLSRQSVKLLTCVKQAAAVTPKLSDFNTLRHTVASTPATLARTSLTRSRPHLPKPHKAHPTKRAFYYDFEEFNDCAYIYLILAKSLGHFFLLNLLYNKDIPFCWIIEMRDEFFEKAYRRQQFFHMYALGRYAPYNGLN